jgi:hypothetical protein
MGPEAGTGLERELVQAVRTVEQLQKRYLEQLLGEADGAEDPRETLEDYGLLCGRLGDWLGQAEPAARAACILHRAMVTRTAPYTLPNVARMQALLY